MLKSFGEKIYADLAEFVPESREPLRILDVGCGTGIELDYIWKKTPNAHITCVDISRGMLEVLEESYRAKGA